LGVESKINMLSVPVHFWRMESIEGTILYDSPGRPGGAIVGRKRTGRLR
jgi:hypothetical protein